MVTSINFGESGIWGGEPKKILKTGVLKWKPPVKKPKLSKSQRLYRLLSVIKPIHKDIFNTDFNYSFLSDFEKGGKGLDVLSIEVDFLSTKFEKFKELISSIKSFHSFLYSGKDKDGVLICLFNNGYKNESRIEEKIRESIRSIKPGGNSVISSNSWTAHTHVMPSHNHTITTKISSSISSLNEVNLDMGNIDNQTSQKIVKSLMREIDR